MVLTGKAATKAKCDERPHLNVVKIIQQWWFLHPKVVRYQRVKAIGQIQHLGLRDTSRHSLEGEDTVNPGYLPALGEARLCCAS